MAYYRHHLFFCTNQRDDGRSCCARFGAAKMQGYLKAKVNTLGLAGPGGVRINTAGCLDRCDKGPVIVVYPEAVWYTYIDCEDLDEILQSHLIDGEVVERLRIR
ncbi:MAG: 2Fe-2S ferredoxin [endosymbiont of Seepiophila jonesi]|uniref:2Fe-2S ferredoxin n=1 Tax=endosymbiont of Lamellibrachia luymesi TaxID=2200907 RepID=A0A370DU55_9GAMM|nr:MAG: 2Fe-2S ferredoxin [endosymbiont of Lamellibrachia luymesi]RDH94328.1 MAG: 2Fe-2S ferredoxin [endosymbiont of Seepiophila jonesi]